MIFFVLIQSKIHKKEERFFLTFLFLFKILPPEIFFYNIINQSLLRERFVKKKKDKFFTLIHFATYPPVSFLFFFSIASFLYQKRLLSAILSSL
jgi:hypothetical protein